LKREFGRAKRGVKAEDVKRGHDFHRVNIAAAVIHSQEEIKKPAPLCYQGSMKVKRFENWFEFTLINVKNAIAHPPQEGYTVPNVDSTLRKIRVSGIFHAEIPGITNCLTQFEYLFKRYSTMPYADLYFNKHEITNELNKMNGKVSGIAVTEPAPLYDVIASLQNGNTYGWKFANCAGKLTVRLDDPARAAVSIPAVDIVNIEELRIETGQEDFVTDLRILYNKNYSAL
jgi:hypothetical protein